MCAKQFAALTFTRMHCQGKHHQKKNIYFWAWSESPKTPPCPQFGQLGPLRFAHMTEFFDDDNDGCNDDYDDNYGKFDDNYEKNY